jgi:transposase InsO family protein
LWGRRREGYRRITRRLRDEGLVVSAKRVLRLMRDDKLEPADEIGRDREGCWRIVVGGTNGRLRKLKSVPTGLDQLWVADITYVRLAETFLSSRRRHRRPRVAARGSSDGRSTTISSCAWPWTRSARRSPGAIRGPASSATPIATSIQYASREYAARLARRGFQRSMSRPGNPYDNAKAEEADGTAYADVQDTRGPHRRLQRGRLQRRPPALRLRLQIADCLRSRDQKHCRSQPTTPHRLVTELTCLNEGVQSTGASPESLQFSPRFSATNVSRVRECWQAG